MSGIGRSIRALVLASVLAVVAAGCAATGSDDAALEPGTVVVDVRTPEEFAQGHLDGAVNLDVQASDAADRLAELDPEGTYVLYCRSGNRAQSALEYLDDLGFTEVTNAGSLEDASASTGLEIVS